MKKRIFFLFNFILLSLISHAQGGDDFLRSAGKIYAVVAVVLVLFLGIVLYLIRIERKIKNLENH